MQILSVYFKHQQGGFNKRLYRVLTALAKNNHSVHCISAAPLPISDPNIQAHILPLPFTDRENLFFWLLFTSVAPIYCAWVAHRYRINKIVVFSSYYSYICTPTVLLTGAALITFLRADVLREARLEKKQKLKIVIHRILEWCGLRFSRQVVANSHTLARAVAGRCPAVKPLVLPNNIDHSISIDGSERAVQRRLYRIAESEFAVTTASPLNRVKNIDLLIKAFAMAKLKNGRLLIIGDDLKKTGERLRLEQLAANQALGDRVVFTGWLEAPQKMIAACDLFVFPSSQEGSPNALLEALACGIPCLGSRIPEIAEILHYRDLMFDISDPGQLAGIIHKTGTDSGFKQHLQVLSNSRKEQFSFNWENRVVSLITTKVPAGRP